MKSGILLINKPAMMTSHQLVAAIKRRFNFKKVGHAGTLDPLATGVMIILINQATKLSTLLLNEDKAYRVKLQFNLETDTGDITGKIINQDNKNVTLSELQDCIMTFPSEYEQVPPKFSAIKVNGKKMYEYARKNQEIPLIKRKVKLKVFELIEFNFPEATLLVKCSKGTYIRSLVIDLASELKTVATVTSLQRISSGDYRLENTVPLAAVKIENVIPLTDVLKEYMPIIIASNIAAVKNGQQIMLKNVTAPQVLLVDSKQQPLAIYIAQEGKQYICKKGLWNNNENS